MKRRDLGALLFIFSVGLLLRMYKLNLNDFWFDEAYMALGTKFILNMPGIFLASGCFSFHVLSFFWKFFGETECMLRLLPLLFGMLSLVMAYRIGKYLFCKKAGVISALLIAISPLHIWYAQEFTPYTALFFLSLLSVFLFLKIIRRGKKRYWIYLTIVNILNIYLHPAAFMILLVEIFGLFYYQQKYEINQKKIFFYSVLTGIFIFPFLHNFANALLENIMLTADAPFYDYAILKNYWIPKPTIASLFWTFKNFSVGYCSALPLSLLGTGSFFALFIYGIYRARGRQKLFLILIFLFSPIMLVFFVSQFIPFYVDRYFISSSLFYYILIANGLCCIKVKIARLICVFIVCAISFLGIGGYFGGYLPAKISKEAIGVQIRRDFAKAVDYIARNYRTGDAIMHNSENTIPSFKYYLHRDEKLIQKPKQLLLYLPAGTNVPEFYEYSVHKFGFQKADMHINRYDGIWLVFASEYLGCEHETDKLKWLDKNYEKKEENIFQGIIVYLYRNKSK